jgi:hypothetical protein
LVRRKKYGLLKKFAFKSHVLEMKLKAYFSKHVFGKKHGKEMSYQTDPIIILETFPEPFSWSVAE